jgi:hypothetical protein
LPRPEPVHAVVEGERDEGETEEREVPKLRQLGRAVQCALERQTELALDLLGGLPG